MNSKERHEARYQRRKRKRNQKLIERQQKVGNLETALSYDALYKSGKEACKGVRWKTSTINFELRIFSRTASVKRKIRQKKWRMKKPRTFWITERGHKRKIDAPHIDDHQVQKAICKQVLEPLYYPHMIYDNGASIKRKGFSFTINRIIQFLHWWYRKYGTDGIVVTTDFEGYFPNAPHKTVEKIHRRYILDDDLRWICDYTLNAFGPVGMALGVETSQKEAGILPNAVDHMIKDQERIKCNERYMDDTQCIVHTNEEADRLIETIEKKSEKEGLKVNCRKTHKAKLDGWFTFCQWRFHLTESGRVIKKPARRSVTNTRRKIKKFDEKVKKGEMEVQDAWNSYQCSRSYLLNGNSHKVIRKADAEFLKRFGILPIKKKKKQKKRKNA